MLWAVLSQRVKYDFADRPAGLPCQGSRQMGSFGVAHMDLVFHLRPSCTYVLCSRAHRNARGFFLSRAPARAFAQPIGSLEAISMPKPASPT